MLIDKGCKTDSTDITLAYQHGHKEALELLMCNKNGYLASPDASTPQQLLKKLESQSQAQEVVNMENKILERLDDVRLKYEASRKQKAPTLPASFRELITLAPFWKTIGEHLKLPPGLLDTISIDNHDRERDCLRETLERWLKITDPLPTWEQLVQAVKPINQEKADSISKKHCVS